MRAIIICFLVFTFSSVFSQEIENLPVTLPGKDITIDSALAIMQRQQSMVFSYSSNELKNKVIHFSKLRLTVIEIVQKISEEADVNYKIQGNKILFIPKKKKYIIRGIIMDGKTGEKLPGANVLIKNSAFGVSSDNNGYYQLQLEAGEYELSYSYVGYEPVEKTVKLASETEMSVSLTALISNVDEVRVTRQRNFWRNLENGRNITSLDSRKLETLNSNNASDILQARVSGVWSTQSSGAPGDHQKVRIRGVNSIFGCTDPLYIINGVAVPIVNMRSLGIADLNVYDIENITVLKDASSNAIYGFQGGNGVIIIDTKHEKEQQINFSTKVGVQRVNKKYDLMNTKDFLSALDTAAFKRVNQIRKFYPVYNENLISTDWQDVVFQDGVVNEYQLSGSGKLGGNYLYLSGNYFTQKGIIENSNYKRYTFSANVGRNITRKLSAELNVRSSYQNNENNLDAYKGNNLLIEGINKSPLLHSTPDSFYFWPQNPEIVQRRNPQRIFYNYSIIGGYPTSKTPTDSLIKYNNNSLKVVSHAVDIKAKYSIMDNFYINAVSSVTFRRNSYQSDIKAGNYFQYNTMKSTENYLLFNQQINFNYQKNINKHEFQITSGYRNYADNAYWNLDSLQNREYTENLYLKNSLAIDGDDGTVIREINSFTGLLNYNYHKKYFISLVANYEFLTLNKEIGFNVFYPSIAISWDLSKENFLAQQKWLNKFAIFGNWGITGNMPINTLAVDNFMKTRYRYGDSIHSGGAISQFANHYLKPEIINEYNTGVTIELLNRKIRLKADYYYKISDNLVIIRDIPEYYAGGRIMLNVGNVVNYGKEINMEIDLFSTSNFLWTTNFALSTNELSVKKIGSEPKMDFYSTDALIPQFVVKENEELGAIVGYKYLGEYTDEDTKAKDIRYANNESGKYLNFDTTNTVITAKDKVIIGKTLPDFTFHWMNSLAYKNFSLEFLWYGVIGVDKFNSTKAATYMAGTNRDILKLMKNKYNRTLTTLVFYQSSYFVEDASFVRLKQLTFAYDFKNKLYNKVNLRVALSFENLITLTKYTGYDPEASIYTDNSFSDFGVDRGAYPNPRSVFLKVDLKF